MLSAFAMSSRAFRTRTRVRAQIAAVAVAVVGGFLTVTTAPASADGQLRLLSPAPGATDVVAGSSLEIDTSAVTSEEQRFSVVLECASGQTPLGELTGPFWGVEYLSVPDDLPLGQRCSVSATDAYGTYSTLGSFTLERLMSDPSQSSKELWPRVRDGYRDDVRVEWWSNRDADYVATVTDSRGRIVRKSNLGWVPGSFDEFDEDFDSNSWKWRGVADTGKVVPNGSYRIKVTGSTGGFTEGELSWPVQVSSGTVKVRRSIEVAGNRSARATRGNCTASRYSYDGTTLLDCWGGKYARASYTVKLPRTTTAVSWSMRGVKPGADMCCRGRVTKSAKRMSKTRFRVTAQVSGWRAYEVREVTVNYRARVQR